MAIHSKFPITRPFLYPASARPTRWIVEMFDANRAEPTTGHFERPAGEEILVAIDRLVAHRDEADEHNADQIHHNYDNVDC